MVSSICLKQAVNLKVLYRTNAKNKEKESEELRIF